MSDSAVDPCSRAAAAQPRWVAWLLAAIVLGTFLIRLPGSVEPLGPDQGVYATIGWGLQRGLALYRDLWEQKPPAIYLTYRAGFDLFGDRMSTVFWIDYLAAAVTVAAIFDLGRRLRGARAGALAAAAVALGTLPAARHALGGFIERSVTEAFIIPLAALAAWATVMAITRRRDAWLHVAGVCIGAAAVYKQTALIYWPALVAWVWWVSGARRAVRAAVCTGVAIAIVPAAAVVWLWRSGVLEDAWIALVRYNMAYLAVGQHGFGFTLDRFVHEIWRRIKTDEVWALGSLAAAAAAIASVRARSAASTRLPSLGLFWLGATTIAIVANGPRMFVTYFMPALIPLSLLAAWLLEDTLGSPVRARRLAGVAVLLFAALMAARSGSIGRAVDTTAWDARHWLGRMDRAQYLTRYQSRWAQAFSAADNERLADYVRARTRPDDRIFVFGMSAGTYFLSERLPAVKFLWAYPAVSNMIDRPDFRVETLAATLARTAPVYIILQRHNGDSFTGWRAETAFNAPPLAAVLRRYTPETEVGDFLLYRRN